MSVYDWPTDSGADEENDDPGARARYVERRRTDFDHDAARRAGRRLPEPPATSPDGAPGGPFAPQTGREHLWQPLGPATVIKGQATGQPRITGRIKTIAVDPTGMRVYAGAANGGVWYSDDGASTWRSLGGLAETNRPEITRPAHRQSCGAIHVEFGSTEAGDEVYVGTGGTTRAAGAQPGGTLGGIGVLVANGPGASSTDDPWTREAPNLIGEGVNRFAAEPGGSGIVAATTAGLFERPNPSSPDADWTRVTQAPFDTYSQECTDVVWTAADGARPERIWVWARSGSDAGLWVRAAGAAAFTRVATPGFARRRTVLAAATPPTQVFVLNNQGSNIPPNLYRVAAAGAAAPVATQVTAGVPNVLGGQGFYDIGMAVDPTAPNRVVMVGNVLTTTTPDGTTISGDGGIVVGDIATVGGVLTFGTPNPPTMIGIGVHADVHDVAYSNGGTRLWVGCDGGMYRSDNPADPAGFRPCNTGLSIVESNYIAGHPTCEGHVVTGLQDNAVITRRSGSVWESNRVGDGGGVVFDPINPDQFMRQHFRGFWSPSQGAENGQHPLRRGSTFAGAEHSACAFYSEAAGIAHYRNASAPAAPDVGQIIIGTTRVWYTEDFGANWVTLPTGTDPLPANTSQDAFGEAITVCKWQSPDVAWILGETSLERYSRTPGSDAAGGPGAWLAEAVILQPPKRKKEPDPLEKMKLSAVWTDVAPNLDPSPGPNLPPTQRGTRGAVYLGTIGDPNDTSVDTLWWFDGTDRWHATGLRNDTDGVPAPVTAIVCDPDTPDEVWVGTTVGVWHGTRTINGGNPPTWAWEAKVNGLPEAACEDLEIFSDDGIKLLRAALAARGSWELRLDVADVDDLVYVRAHDDDLRHRSRAIETQRDLLTPRSWHGSPDVRPRVASAPLPAPASLFWVREFFDFDSDGLRRFQAALRSQTGDLRVRATGGWDDHFNEVLRSLGAPAVPPPSAPNRVSIDQAFWNTQMVAPHDSADPWGTGPPTEADLLELTAPLSEGDVGLTSMWLNKVVSKVDVVVHHRGLGTVDGSDVRVTLLRWIDPRAAGWAQWGDHRTWFSGDVPWTAAVNEVLNASSATTSETFADGWSFVGSNAAARRKTLTGQTLEPLNSGVATFDLDLTGVRDDDVVLLVAVVRHGSDIALGPASLEELVLTNPSVAVRSLRVRP